MADRQKEGPSKKRSGKAKRGKSSGAAGKPKFSAGTPPTACEPEPLSLSPPKLDFQLQPIDLPVDPPVVSTVLSDLPADPRRVGPFQGQDGSPESITQAGVPRQSEVDRVSDSHGDSTGAPPGVSTVELAVSTPVSRRRTDADMESLTRQMADDKAFCEERTKKTEAMLVSFLAKAKGAPPAVLEAWGISPPSQEPSAPARSVTVRPEQPSSVSGKQKQKGRSSGNRDNSLPRSKGRGSRGSRRSRMPQAEARVSTGAHNQPVKGRSHDPPAQRGRKEQSRGSSARCASSRRGDASSSRRSARGRSPHKRGGASRKDRSQLKEPSAYETFHLEGPRRASPKHFGRTHYPSPPRGYAELQYHTVFRSPSERRSRRPKRSRKRKDRPDREPMLN